MRISDILKDYAELRNIADNIVDHDQPAAQSATVVHTPIAAKTIIPRAISTTTDTITQPTGPTIEQPNDKFLPPLQLKLELLKKASGVESVYDEEPEDEEEDFALVLQQLRKNAGLSTPIMNELSDDEQLDI